MPDLASIPWKSVTRLHRSLRRSFFRAERPAGTYFRVYPDYTVAMTSADVVADLERDFGRRSWAPNWEYSYDKGEALNLARVVYEEDAETGLTWFQYHVRGWAVVNDAVDVGGHWEPEPTEHPDAHYREVGFDRLRGMAKLEEVLNEIGADYDEVNYDG